jgi:hypothetical protein
VILKDTTVPLVVRLPANACKKYALIAEKITMALHFVFHAQIHANVKIAT